MPCLFGCLALLTPRIVLLVVWLFTHYLDVYRTWVWPFLGFIFMPLTTLAYAFAMHENQGTVNGLYLALVVIAALIDLGFIGGSEASRRRRLRRA